MRDARTARKLAGKILLGRRAYTFNARGERVEMNRAERRKLMAKRPREERVRAYGLQWRGGGR